MNWIAAISAVTTLGVALGVGLRWLGQQIWQINRYLATQTEAIKWQNTQFCDLHQFDASVESELDILKREIADVQQYLENQTSQFERPFVIRGRSRSLREP